MNSSGHQALKNPLGTPSPGTSNASSKLTSEQIRNISKRLGQILGDEDGNANGEAVIQNEKGEILNEENLPIIEISEPLPLDADFGATTSGAPLIKDQSNSLPLWALSSAQLQRRRAERDRILDILEEEERVEQEKDEHREDEERQNALRKRREAAKRDLGGLRAARDLQKKMGRALIRNMAEMREKEEVQNSEQLTQDTAAEKERKGLKPRKSVAFALPAEGGGEPKERLKPIGSEADFDWGDVTPARLSAAMHPGMSFSRPMKTTVVERFPQSIQSTNVIPPEGDSDDESVPRSPSASSDEIGTLPHDVNEDTDDSTDGDDDGLEPLPEEFDLDIAQHQREIALQYYEQRNKIGARAAAALTSHSHDPNEDPWDQPEVPLEASLAGERPKPVKSRFKADRLSSASTTLEGSILPVSQSHVIQRAIHTGKVEGGNLVGNDESDNEEEEMKAILALLQQGVAVNVGPTAATSSSSDQIPSQVQPASENHTTSRVESKRHPKSSKFKLARKEASGSTYLTPTTPHSQTIRSSASKIIPQSDQILVVASHVEDGIAKAGPESSSISEDMLHPGVPSVPRKSPVSDTVMERMPVRAPSHGQRIAIPNASSRAQGRASSAADSAPQLSMIVDSPSFPPPFSSNPASSIASALNPDAFVISSPSFPPPPDRSGIQRTSRSVLMSDEVRESTGARGARELSGNSKEKKISRFSADRM